MRVSTGGLAFVSLAVLLLSLGSLSPIHGTTQAAPQLVPTAVCVCQSDSGGSSTPATPRVLRGPPHTGAAYDEQIGMTFTQSFTSLEYNVTAVAQTDATLSTGPGYLLNGLSNTGYWYQVGLSWNWSPGQTPGTGFDMNYEVFDRAQNSIFPSNGGGGVQGFSGKVNQGDLVLLNLYFTNSSQIVMAAEDVSTGAFASESYAAQGTFFTGSPNSVANSNGYFTGLMTEWYHGNPFYANGKQVTYSDPQFQLTSAWMWMDEFNANNNQPLFSANTPSPVAYTDPTKLQEFSYNGTAEYSDAYEFITGNLTGTTTTSTVPLTFSSSVLGGGSGYSASVLTYVSDGAQLTALLNSSQVTYQVDVGSTWSVPGDLAGSSPTQRWQTQQPTSGIAASTATMTFQYYHQYQVEFGFSVSGGGTGYSSPVVTYQSFGSSQSVTLPTGANNQTSLAPAVWVDSGSRYDFANPLPGSSSGERWDSSLPSGSVDSIGTITVGYYNQYLIAAKVSFVGSEVFPSVTLKSTSEGSPFVGTLVEGTNSFWLDAHWTYLIPQTVSLFPGERWATNASAVGSISNQLTISLVYEYQDYVAIGANAAAGGTTSSTSGWYPPGTSLQITAAPNSGWKFEGWTGAGQGSAQGSSAALSLLVNGPANETATFYPGVTVTSNGPVPVSYSDGSNSGTISAGKSAVIYVPPNSTISLKASTTPFFYSFNGWSGASTASESSISLTVSGPESLAAGSSYNYAAIMVVVAAVVLIILGGIVTSRRKWTSEFVHQKETVGSPAA